MVNVLFSEKEIEYLNSQHIARMATAAGLSEGKYKTSANS
jgi:hypothetical protein